jgi:hypothetical protein
MALTKTDLDYQRWRNFNYFESGKADGFSQISVNPGKPWMLRQVRIHFSSVFASVEDLVLQISSINGSYFDHLLVSRAMLSADTYIVGWDSDVLLLFSDDYLNINLSMKSNVNGWGIEVLGWAAAG